MRGRHVERLTVTACDWLDVVVCPPRNELTLTCAVSTTDGGWFFRVAAFKERCIGDERKPCAAMGHTYIACHPDEQRRFQRL